MVSWGRAFRGAAAVVGFAIIWWIIGAALVGAGFYVSGWFGLYGSSEVTYTAIGIGAVLIFCGSIISILGVIAAFLKVLPEIVAEEVRGK